ncbi:MAG: hypothetical protein JSW17_05305 [Candidatus Omnitrophota bacterium]|nr:MAG: hypothetical protein JSW17_05305 [Candidatus Omnitrophota bacterium]
MNSREELIESFKRILWLEKEMKDNYSSYRNAMQDEILLSVISEIEADEARHINMAEGILSILKR